MNELLTLTQIRFSLNRSARFDIGGESLNFTIVRVGRDLEKLRSLDILLFGKKSHD